MSAVVKAQAFFHSPSALPACLRGNPGQKTYGHYEQVADVRYIGT